MKKQTTTIRAARQRRELSQREAARRAGIAVATWNRIESGRVPFPHRSTLRAMAATLRVALDALDGFGWNEETVRKAIKEHKDGRRTRVGSSDG